VTHLRKMMLEELQRRNYSQATTQRYIRFVERFARLAKARTLLAHCLVENAVVHESIVEWTADLPSVSSDRRIQ
jgi:hypothetical protein